MAETEIAKTATDPHFWEMISKLHPVAQVAAVIVIGAVVCVGLVCAMKASIAFWGK